MTARAGAAAALALALALGACGGDAPADRGRRVFLGQCASCHASDPAREGPLGPPVQGASRDLLEARLLRGTYPPGYTPKRPTAVMQPMPHLADSIDDLAAFLAQ
jgi:mono/diheme cytochrome c family protein